MKEIRKRQIPYGVTYVWKLKKIEICRCIEYIGVFQSWLGEVGKRHEDSRKVKPSSYELRGYDVYHGNYS